MADTREERRAQRRRAIQEHACRLVVSHGFDGFTMDDLARAVGVSRRTLFNHVPDKFGAVLGEGPGHFEASGLAQFVAGGPTGELVPDCSHLVRSAFAQAELEIPDARDRVRLVERAVASDPKLATTMKFQAQEKVSELTALVCRREGWADDDLRARVITARIIATVLLVLDEVVRSKGVGSFVDVFDSVSAAEAQVMASAQH